MASILKDQDYYDCLLMFYFGRNGDVLQSCLNRAYGDLKRTVHGIGKHPRADEVRRQADQFLKERFASIQAMREVTQSQFDDWHRKSCSGLSDIYKKHRFKSFSVGQAQKWINMTFKYIFFFREHRLLGFDHLRDACHAPLDKEFTRCLGEYEFEPLPCVWSRLNDYETYLDRQQWLRDKFALVPLDVEFLVFMGRPLLPDTVRKF